MNNNFIFPDNIREVIQKKLNPALIKTREDNKKSMNYISGSTVVDILNTAFNYNWDWIAEKEWITDGVTWFNKYFKDETGKTIGRHEEQGPIAHVRGKLIVRFTDDNSNEHIITKSGYGSKCIIGKQSEQDSIFKAADTDALKKAASRLGIGAELYRSEEENMYFDMSNDPTAWTDEALHKYQNALDYINNIMSQYNSNDQNVIVTQFGYGCQSLEDINPTNIDNFVDYLTRLNANNTDTTNIQ